MIARAYPLVQLPPQGWTPPLEKEREPAAPEHFIWDPGLFAEQQLRRLVRQVFFPGWPKPSHHVAFIPVGEETDAAPICIKVGEILARYAPGETCIVEADDVASKQANAPQIIQQSAGGSLQRFSRHVGDKLWLLPAQVFWGQADEHPPDWLASRMQQLRSDFDYTILHLPSAASHDEAATLARLSDGVVLVLEANATRRVTAQRVKETLLAAHVRVLGTVLNGRTFPIPEKIYRKL